MRLALITCFLAACWAGPVSGQRKFGFDNRKSSGQPYLTPEETVRRMKVADGFEVSLFAGEPDLVNPIAFTVDERGRVWVVECFEYPKRTPQGKMPRDRIRLLEDTDGDGRCDKSTVWAEGKDFPVRFDLASGIEVGHGGVFLGAAPYLWHLKDTDNDGRCDKYEILLKGFGSQDTHETLNTFQWGPDGRLYGLHGVFTQSEVGGVKLNAAAWRYDVHEKKFERFAEGTSNPWGMDFRNSDGQAILCCCVIPHLFHLSPGGVYKRQAGGSYNPHAYGYIKEICDHTFHRESGWAHAGLVSLDCDAVPPQWRDSVIFGSIHGCSIKRNVLSRRGSTYVASRGDDFLVSGDKNFRPINMKWAPDGSIYLIDWHDQNPCHQAKPESWDYERGRVYRIARTGSTRRQHGDMFAAMPEARLVDLACGVTAGDSPWAGRTARRLLCERRGSLSTRAKQRIRNLVRGGAALPAMWAAACAGALDEELFRETIRVNQKLDPARAGWLVRLVSDGGSVEPATLAVLVRLAADAAPVLRRDLASAAVRLSVKHDTRPLLRRLLKGIPPGDPLLPQLTWLAYETEIVSAGREELNWLAKNAPGDTTLTDHIVPRTVRRLVATGDPAVLAACVRFVTRVDSDAVRRRAMAGMLAALKGRKPKRPAGWLDARGKLTASADAGVRDLARKLSAAFGDAAAVRRAISVASDAGRPAGDRLRAVRELEALHPPAAMPVLKRLIAFDGSTPLRAAAVRAVAGYNVPELADALLSSWKGYPPAVRDELVRTLSGRKAWAAKLLDAVAAGTVARTALNDTAVLRIRGFGDKALDRRAEQVWGRVRETPEQLLKVIAATREELAEPGSAVRGKAVFTQHCAKCHVFDGAGHAVGPRLDGAERSIDYILANVLDPNRVIGRPYYVRTVALADGRIETGLLVEENDRFVKLKGENAVEKVFAREDIARVMVSEKSVMPEGFGYNMSKQDFRDLVRYLMANPYLTAVRVGDRAVTAGVDGRIPLPAGRTATVRAAVKVDKAASLPLRIDGAEVVRLTVNGRPADAASVPLSAGVNVIECSLRPAAGSASLRFIDPLRTLTQVAPTAD